LLEPWIIGGPPSDKNGKDISAVCDGLNLKISHLFRLTVAISKMAGAHWIGNDSDPFLRCVEAHVRSTRGLCLRQA
jgi:hypothetical protein